MATIGTFTHDSKTNTYKGKIETLCIKANVTIVPNDQPSSTAPDYRVFVGSNEVGAAWSKTSQNNNPYLSVKLDDPSLASPIFASLIADENGKHNLLWSRARRQS